MYYPINVSLKKVITVCTLTVQCRWCMSRCLRNLDHCKFLPCDTDTRKFFWRRRPARNIIKLHTVYDYLWCGDVEPARTEVGMNSTRHLLPAHAPLAHDGVGVVVAPRPHVSHHTRTFWTSGTGLTACQLRWLNPRSKKRDCIVQNPDKYVS